MEIITLDNFLKTINYSNPELDDFLKIGNATSLSNQKSKLQKQSDKINFSRGLLLYGLVNYLKPKSILEIGTGGGYSALCMAKALVDFKIPGKIYTIDRVGHDEKITRFYQLPDDTEPHEGQISNKEIWNHIAQPEWIDKIVTLKGYSGTILGKPIFNDIDFCYIDGNHSYAGVKHDFLSLLTISANSFSVLFDDYIDRDFYGVKEFIDKEVEPHFLLKLIKTDVNEDLKKLSKIKHEYGMIYLNHKSETSAIKNYNIHEVNTFLEQYRKNDSRIRTTRYNLEKKIPFLKNVKFKFWENNQ